jgi:hypothetical protein
MGLVLAIFCFIVGIPIFLGGPGPTGWGVQQYMRATPKDRDQWIRDATLHPSVSRHLLEDKIY